MWMRWLSALVGASMLFSITYFFGSLGVVLVSSVIVILAMLEFTQLFSHSKLMTCMFMLCGLGVFVTHLLSPQYTLAAVMLTFVFLASKGLVYFSNHDSNISYSNVEWTLWGILYCALSPALVLNLTQVYGWKVLYFLLITVFLGDSFALFAGMTVGGKKIFPKISPKKTYSGAIGGLLGSCLFGVGFMYFTSPVPIDLLYWILVCATIGFFGQLGDFFESLIKRQCGKKDSGYLMPGHGGFLDRLDGVYFGSIILFLYAQTNDLSKFFS
jgi:phosphatidate cytidylyltransferase